MIRLGRKDLPGANTQAYVAHFKLRRKLSVMHKAPDYDSKNHCYIGLCGTVLILGWYSQNVLRQFFKDLGALL
jgi:hypothetical protein